MYREEGRAATVLGDRSYQDEHSPKASFVVGENTTRTELYLQGHTQGDIPLSEIIQETITGSPMDWAVDGRTPEEQAVFDEGVEQVILHTEALNLMRQNHQHGYKVLSGASPFPICTEFRQFSAATSNKRKQISKSAIFCAW